eukprot:2590829-Amphidinium_carterae.1
MRVWKHGFVPGRLNPALPHHVAKDVQMLVRGVPLEELEWPKGIGILDAACTFDQVPKTNDATMQPLSLKVAWPFLGRVPPKTMQPCNHATLRVAW